MVDMTFELPMEDVASYPSGRVMTKVQHLTLDEKTYFSLSLVYVMLAIF